MTVITHYSNKNQAIAHANYPTDSIDWLTRLIAFDTVSRHSNLALIEDVQSYCEQLGLTVDLTFNDVRNKANLFVTVPAGANADEVNQGLAPIQAKVAELNAQMQARAPETGIELLQEESVPAMTDSDSAELQALIAALTGDDKRHKVAYATEGGQFTNAGIPTIICGPGSIEQAHKADEYVALSEIERCDKFLQKLLNSCAIN